MSEYTYYYQSPLGELAITGSPEGISTLRFTQDSQANNNSYIPSVADQDSMGLNRTCLRYAINTRSTRELQPWIMACIEELNRYFAGTQRESFTIKLRLKGTEFQKRVWEAVQSIPYGTTVSYQEIARAVGSANACRAVGNANHRNPLPLLIPCHRVIGSNQRLTGYAGGLWRKKWLLSHELHWVNHGLGLGSEQDRNHRPLS